MLVGTTSGGERLSVAATQDCASFKNTGGTGKIYFLDSGAATIGSITWTGTINNTGNIKTNNISTIFTSTAELYTSSIRTSAIDGTTVIHDAYINTQFITAQGFVNTNQLNTSGLLANQVFTTDINNNSSITTTALSTSYISASKAFVENISTSHISTNDLQVQNICTFGTAYFADLTIEGAQKFGGSSTITNAVLNATYPIDITAFSVYNIVYSQNTTITANPTPTSGYVMNIVASNSGTTSRSITFDPTYFKTSGNMTLGAGNLGVINFITYQNFLLELSRRINI